MIPANPPNGYGFGEGSIIGTLTPTRGYPRAEPARVSKPVPFTSGGVVRPIFLDLSSDALQDRIKRGEPVSNPTTLRKSN